MKDRKGKSNLFLKPKQIHIEPMVQCNLNCIFCPINKIKERNILTERDVIDLIDQVANLQPEYLDFVNYCEPLLNPNFLKYMAIATFLLGEGHLGVVTNGTMMNGDIAAQLVLLRLKILIFSIDGYHKGIYEKVRLGANRDLVYANVEFYLDYLKQNRIVDYPPSIVMTVCEENESDIPAFLEYWNQKEVIPRVYKCTGRGGEKAYTEPNDNPCSSILDGMWILSNGVVVPCCEDYSGMNPVGNIYENSLEEIWNCEAFWDFRIKHIERRKSEIPLCAQCRTSQDRWDHNLY